jgi:hypothetical protein
VIATVKGVNGNPVPDGFGVTFQAQAADLEAGGHDHPNINQAPTGAFATATGTAANSCTTVGGTCELFYVVPQDSGRYNITASSSTPSIPATPATAPLLVAVEDMASTELAEQPGTFFLTGQPGRQTVLSQHNHNHYGTQHVEDTVREVAIEFSLLTEKFSSVGRQELGINDMSLVWGGLFDIGNNWLQDPGHHLHRNGNSVDIDNAVTVNSTSYNPNPTVTLKAPGGSLPLLKTLFCYRNMFQIKEGPIHFEVVPDLCKL